ncbi:carbohydrate-binding domain-containing protein [Lysinibacillus sp. LZ02]|uniref:carbohydrate-binding domain-containing protein n=1 Tax=Lysinibacillus sp. LZ02 TaxID=3420668 RepID=UPI003D36760C
MRKVKYIVPFILIGVMLGACSHQETQISVDTDALVAQYVTYSEDDFYSEWQGSSFTKIHLNGASAVADGPGGVVIENGVIEIRTTGTYIIDGTLDDGQIVVDAEDDGTVRLILNGTSITSSTSAAIYVKQADQTVISLEAGTENVVTDAKEYVFATKEDEPSGAIFSKDDLSINGDGKLIVNANYKDGIVGRDELIVTGGHIEINAEDDGIVGRDLFAMRDANIKVTANGDGMKSSNDEDAEKGNIVLQSGSLQITAGLDGVQSERDVLVVDGQYSIVAGGGSPETMETRQEFRTGSMQGGMMGSLDMSQIQQYIAGEMTKEELLENIDESQLPDDLTVEDIETMFDQMKSGGVPQMGDRQRGQNMTPPNMNSQTGEETATKEEGDQMPEDFEPSGGQGMTPPDVTNEGEENTSDDESISTKGIKATTLIQIESGTLTIDSEEDALHSDGHVTINGGQFTINTGDDGIHADADVVMTAGTVRIEKSYEGIEGVNVTIKNGDIYVQASDDGININGGSSDFDRTQTTETEETNDSESLLLIEGGYVYVNADGDGLDSNGNIKMTAGTVVVYGPTNAGNGALDYDGTFTVEGGTLMAAGSSGMAMGLSDTSAQKALMMTFTNVQESGTIVNITTATGEVIATVAPEKAFQTLVISTPDLAPEESYTVNFGGTVKGEAKNGVYSEASTMVGMTGSVEFILPSQVMTYLNESGITENSSGMMMPGGGGGFGGPRGNRGTMNQPSNQQEEIEGSTS